MDIALTGLLWRSTPRSPAVVPGATYVYPARVSGSPDRQPKRYEGANHQTDVRAQWQAEDWSATARNILTADADVFLHPCRSTVCLNALHAATGVYVEDVQGRRIMDFHGNYVHQVGYRHPRVVTAVGMALQIAKVATGRYFCRSSSRLASLWKRRKRRRAVSPWHSVQKLGSA